MNLSNIIKELKRRNVFKVAIAYAVAGWLIIQVFATIAPQLNFPDWIAPLVTVIVLIGFPLALIFAWAFELTPEGIQRSEEIEITESVTASTGKKLNGLIIGVLSVTIVFLLADRFYFSSAGADADSAVPVRSISDKSIAVLPFDDFNAGGEQEYFADGLTEEILNSLAKTPDLLVASRTSSFQYKDKNIDIVRIADTLGVAHVLEGSVRESTDRYRITAQLIRASDGFHLWSETYDRPKTDIIDIQEEIAFQIATALETAMDPEELRKMVEAGTSSIEAYKLYVEGLSILNIVTDLSRIERAFQKFEQAVKLDPEFASAHYQSANAVLNDMAATTMGTQILDYTYPEKLKMIDERLRQAIQFAGETDHIKYLAAQALANQEFRKAADYLIQYTETNPSQLDNYITLMDIFTSLGEHELAREYHAMAMESVLDNKFNAALLVAVYFWSDNVEAADPWMQQKLDQYPYTELLAYQSHRIMLWRGETERAAETLKRLKGIVVPEESLGLAKLRQACAEGKEELAAEIYENSIKGASIGTDWIALKTLQRDVEADELIRFMDEEEQLINLSGWLYYRYFDYTKYPNLLYILERENHVRGPVIDIPFRCGA